MVFKYTLDLYLILKGTKYSKLSMHIQVHVYMNLPFLFSKINLYNLCKNPVSACGHSKLIVCICCIFCISTFLQIRFFCELDIVLFEIYFTSKEIERSPAQNLNYSLIKCALKNVHNFIPASQNIRLSFTHCSIAPLSLLSPEKL